MRVRLSVCLLILLSLGLLLFGCSNSTPTPADNDTTGVVDDQGDTTPADDATTVESDTPETTPEDASSTPSDTEEPPTVDGTPADAAQGALMATINGRPIYETAFQETKEALLGQYGQLYSQFGMDINAMLQGASGFAMDLSIGVDALDRLFYMELIAAETERLNIIVPEDEAEAEFQKQYATFLEQQGLTEETLAPILEANGYPLEDFKADARESTRTQMVIQKTQRALVEPIEVSDEDVLAYFSSNQANYNTEEEIHAAHILVDEREEAEALLVELEGGADFAELAVEHSTGPTGPSGGDLGWFGRGMMVGAFEDAAFALEIGAVSDIVETEFGFHIIRLIERREAHEPTFEEVADQVRTDAESELIQEKFTEWYGTAYEAAQIAIEQPLLDATRKQQLDPDLGLEAYEAIVEEGTLNVPYVSYIIGTIYENKLTNTNAQKDELEAIEGEDAEREAQIAALEAEAEGYRQQALAAYQRALDELIDDAEIAARIETLNPSEPEESADEADTAEPQDTP